jgi:hypothetical protein
MNGNLQADLTAMSIGHIWSYVCGIGLLIIVLAVVVYILVKKLNVASIGPVKMEQQNQSTMHDMNEKTRDLDDLCRKNLRQLTSNMKIAISNILAGMNMCTIARIALSSTIKFPLYESVINNHFTTELMPDAYNAYRQRIIDQVKDEYVSISTTRDDLECAKTKMPCWEEVADKLIDCIDTWLNRICREVMQNCSRKKAIYERYLHDFKEVGDNYRIDIIKKCISKNEKYITALKQRIVNRSSLDSNLEKG